MIDTQEMTREARMVTVGASAITQKGIMIAMDVATATAVKASATGGLRVIGINDKTALAGAQLEVRSGIFLFDNHEDYPLAQKDIGQHANCFVYDEHTVRNTSDYVTAGVVAGDVVDVVSQGVYVYVGHDSGT